MFIKSLALTPLLAASAFGAALVQYTGFSPNPTNVGMYVYKPDTLPANPGLVVALHHCQGSAKGFYGETQYAAMAQQYGYIVLFPNAPDSGGCWDVHTTATLTHNAGGDSLGVASAVRQAITQYKIDANKVFVAGTSSGAMMTNVMLGAYPDLFKAGAGISGVPYGCFAGSGLWNNQCANGQLIKTGQQWGDQVRSGYPGYTGPRPKFQFWHGTADTTLYYQNFKEEIKQWTNVFGVSETPSSTYQNTPQSGYTLTNYGPNVEAISAQGVGHTVPEHAKEILQWFGFISGGWGEKPTTTSVKPTTTAPTSTSAPSTSPTTAPPTTVAPTTSAPTTTSPPSSGTVPIYGQCGGEGYTGPTVCASGSTCKFSNQWYSQCL